MLDKKHCPYCRRRCFLWDAKGPEGERYHRGCARRELRWMEEMSKEEEREYGR